ncbi:MAG: cytidylate kinase-like family protein [Clostridia bacterium]|nr:cytidylate kinase-like family protein [Clostridia bacterium]
MNIITISREFGSGGRELGRQIAEILDYDYYDREIIATIAERHDLDENYVEHALTNHIWHTIPLTYAHSFATPIIMQTPHVELLQEQRKVIEEIAKSSKNFVIVGRNADVLLRKFNPFNIFVCADMPSKIARCKARAEGVELNFTDKDFMQKIKNVDKNRERTRAIIADGTWGNRHSYHLIVNTTDWDLNQLAISVSDMAKRWSENKGENS